MVSLGPREDWVCPHCPQWLPPFRLDDIGLKISYEEFNPTSETVKITATQPNWIRPAMDHLRASHPDEWEKIITAWIDQQSQGAVNEAARIARESLVTHFTSRPLPEPLPNPFKDDQPHRRLT